MSLKIKTVLLFCALVFGHTAMAQDAGDAGDLKAKLDAVNAQIEATTKENDDLKAQLADLQTQIDDLKKQSEEKEAAIKELQEKTSGSGDSN